MTLEILDPSLIGVVATHTQAALTFIVRDADGDDSNDGLTELTPLKTLPAAIAKAPAHIDHPVSFRLGDGSYVLPSFTRSLAAPFAFVGDGAGIGDGFTEIVAEELAGAGTSATQIVKVGGGMAPDAFRGHAILITEGPGVGQRAEVKRNTATAYTFAKGALTVALTDASKYRVLRPTVTLTFSETEIVAPSAPAGGFTPTGLAPAIVFAQVTLQCSAFLGQLSIDSVTAYYGVEWDTATNPWILQASQAQFYGGENLFGGGGYPVALFGAASNDDWLGWGVYHYGSTVPTVGEFVATAGYLVSEGTFTVGAGANFTMFGGRISPSSASPAVTASFGGIFTVNAGEVENEGAGPAVEARDNGLAFMGNANAKLIAPTGPLLKASRGGTITAGAISGTAGGLVAQAEGGQIYFIASPTLDGASPGSDYSVGVAAPVTAGKAAFGSAGGHINHTDGSVILRSS